MSYHYLDLSTIYSNNVIFLNIVDDQPLNISMRHYFLFLLLVGFTINGFSQELPNFTHYYANPYIYNPAYAGIEGRPTISLTHRRQWIGIEDAPVTSNITFHTPVVGGFNMGLNVTQDNYGIFQASGALLSLGYTVQLGFNQYVTFGMSGGGKFQNIDLTGANPNDPAIIRIQSFEKTTKLDGNAGLAYHIAGFSIGFSLQNIFNTSTFPTETFDTGELGLIRNYMVTADYMLYFGNDDYIFQPYGSYRSFEGYGTQFEAGGIFHVKHLLWVGGSYRQDFGIIGLLGVKIKDAFSIGYGYEMPTTKANGINKTSHEIQLNLAFGKKKDRAKKHSTFLASRKPVKPKKKKKAPPPVVEEPVEEPVEVVGPLPEQIQDALDSLNQGDNKVRVITDGEVWDDTPEEPVVVETTPEPVPEYIKPAAITKRGNHPFEMDEGHYIVVGAYGVAENAIRMNDKLLSQGYDSDFGFNSEKNIFYVFIQSEDSAEAARSKRDDVRKNPAFSKAWYLLVE